MPTTTPARGLLYGNAWGGLFIVVGRLAMPREDKLNIVHAFFFYNGLMGREGCLKTKFFTMRRFFLSLTVLALMCPVASSAKEIEEVKYQESSARNLEPEHYMLLTPLVADIKVSPSKIKHTETEAFKDFAVTADITKIMPDLKKIALSRAATAHNADLLVGAIIDIVTNERGLLEITVTGYPASYTSFRNATQNDIELIRSAKGVTQGKDNLDVIKNPTNTELEIKK